MKTNTHKRIYENGKWGILNADGEYLCEPQYDSIKYVEKYGTFIVRKDDKFGILNHDGSVLISPQYLHISPYTAWDMQSKGYEITQAAGVGWLSVDGKELIPPRFGQFEQINNLFVAATSKNEYFSINGEKLAHLQWPSITDFNNGYAKVVQKTKSGVIDADGNQIIPCIYNKLNPFVPGKPIPVQEGTEAHWGSGGPWGFINLQNEVVIDYRFASYVDDIPFQNGFARVVMDKKKGVIDESGKLVIPCEYRALGEPQVSHVVFMNDRDGYIDYQNNQFLLEFDNKQNKFIYQDKDGNPGHIPCARDVFPLIEDSFYKQQSGKWGMLDGENNIIVDIIYDEIAFSFCGKLAYVKKDGKYAFLHREKGLITDFIYDDACMLMKDYGLGTIDGLSAAIGVDGQLTEACFSEVGDAGIKFYDYVDGIRVPVNGGFWDYDVTKFQNRFYSKDYKHIIAEDYETYTQFTPPDVFSAQPYIRAYDAKRDCYVMIFGNGEIQALPVTAARVDPVFNTAVKPALKENNLPLPIQMQKIGGAKNKINPNYEVVDDYYYMNQHHSKLIKRLEGYTNRFHHTLSVAISHWIMARLQEGMDQHLNLQYVFDKLSASYISGLSALSDIRCELVQHQKITGEWCSNSEWVKRIEALRQPDDAEKIQLGIISTLCRMHSYALRRSVFSFGYYKTIAEYIVLARMVLPPAKKKVFDSWLDEKLEAGKRLYSSANKTWPGDNKTYRTEGVYYFYADEFVPLEFFFADDFSKDRVPVYIKTALENAEWDNNPYLVKAAYEKFMREDDVLQG